MKNILKKEWWKGQMKMRDSYWILYGFWTVYGGWLLSKTILFIVLDIPVAHYEVAGGYMIAFTWFFFYCLNSVHERSHIKLLWKWINLERERADEYFEYIQKIQKLVEEKEKIDEAIKEAQK